MANKFEDAFKSTYSKHLALIAEINNLTDELGRLLSQHHSKNKFIPTAMEFARVCVETPDCIVGVTERGHLSQAYALLRWYLELSNLLLFLWRNPEEFEKWLKGKKIQPVDARQFLEEIGVPNWQETYKEWCNVVHGNSAFMEHYHVLAKRTPTDQGQILLVGNILLNIAFISQKANYFLWDVLASVPPPIELRTVKEKALAIDQELKVIYNTQMAAEKQLMES